MEDQSDYLTDAMEMLGKGYDSGLEIHPATTVIRRHGWDLVEEVVPAFVKISTGFKKEMRDIEPTALKVWLYIALSINRNTEQAHPGIRKLSEDCGLAQNTVTKAIKQLEQLGLLTVHRAEKRYNIYEIPAHVSANSASPIEADRKTASPKRESASPAVRRNQSNQSNNNNDDRNPFKQYEANIGPLTPMIADEIVDWQTNADPNNRFPDEWILDAIKSAVEHNKRNLAYIRRCLVNRKSGYTYPKKSSDTTRKPESQPRAMPDFVDGVAQFPEEK